MWKWMDLFLRKNHLLRWCVWPSLLNCTGALTLSLLLKLSPRKLEPKFILWSFVLLRLLCTSIIQPYTHLWNTIVTSGLMPLLLKIVWQVMKVNMQGCRSFTFCFSHRQNVASLSKVCTPPFLRGRLSPQPNFQKGVGVSGPQLLEGVVGKEGHDFFQGGLQFSHKE